jgi:uncharacterized protein RhaS with RHS repeats
MYAFKRQYNPTLGRFTGRDPLGYRGGISLYGAYFIPNQVDPNGTLPGNPQTCNQYLDCTPEKIASHNIEYPKCTEAAQKRHDDDVKQYRAALQVSLDEVDRQKAEKLKEADQSNTDLERWALYRVADAIEAAQKNILWAAYAEVRLGLRVRLGHEMRVCDLMYYCRGL